jgi:hypothetical protein
VCNLFMVIATLTIVNRWANRCIDSETGMFDLCDTELDDLWQQLISFTGKRVMNSLKKISGSLRGKLLSKLVFHKNAWVTLLIVLYIRRFVHTGLLACSWQTFEVSLTRNLPAVLFFCTIRMKLRLLKQNLIVLNEWQSSRLNLP